MNLLKKIVAIATITSSLVMMAGPAMGATIAELEAQIAALLEQLATLQTQLAELKGEAPTVEGCTITSFDRNLSQGMSGDDVKCLQIILNSDPDTQLATEGVGSPGEETNYFGPLTKAAVIKFQEKYADEVLASWGLTTGTGFVGSTTRAKLNELLVPAEEEEEEEEEEVVEGVLTVSLSADTPATGMVPQQAAGVEFLRFNLANGYDTTITVSSIVVKRVGLGASTDFDNVYLYEGTTRLTDGRSVSASTNQATFTSLSLEISAGETKAISVKADISSTTTGPTNAFQITSADSITTTADEVEGDFPITGNYITVSSATIAGTLTIAKGGDVTDPTIGEEGAEIAKFTLEADGEDVAFQQINLVQKGSLDADDISNIELYKGTTLLASVDALNANEIAELVLTDPYVIEDGDTINFSVTADLIGEKDDTIIIYLDEDTDLVGIGQDYGYGVGVDSTGYDGSDTTNYTDSNKSTLQGGQLTLAFNGPTAGDIPVDSNDVVLMRLSLTAGTAATIKEFDVEVEAVGGNDTADDEDLLNDTTDEANLTDIKIKKDGVTIMGPEELDATNASTSHADDITQTLTFTEDWDIAAGETVDLEITADIDDDTPDDEDYRVTFDISTLDAEDANGDTITDIVPSADIEGNTMTTQTADLTVSLATTPVSDTAVKGTTGVEVVGFLFEAGSASDITVTEVTFAAEADADGVTSGHFDGVYTGDDVNAWDTLSSVSIYDGATLLDGPETISSSTGKVTFDNLSWVIPAGTSKKLVAKADIATTAAADADDDYVYLDIDDIAVDITSEDEDGNNVIESGTDHENYTNVTGSTGPSVYLTVAPEGTLAVSIGSGTPDSELVVAGTEDVPFSQFRFDATEEAFVIEKLTLKNSVSGTDANIASVKLEYPTETGTGTATGWLEGGKAEFSGLDMYVPADDKAILTVKANLSEIDAGAVNEAAIDLDFDGASTFKAIGQGSGVTIDENDTGIVDADANEMYVYGSIPTVEFASDTPEGNLLVSDNTLLAKIEITADEADDITFISADGNLLSIQYSSVANDNDDAADEVWKLKKSDGTTLDDDETSAVETSGQIDFDFSQSNLTIPAGTTVTLLVYAETNDDLEDEGDSIQIWLDDENTDINWSIDEDGGNYQRGAIIFRGEPLGGVLVTP